MKQDLADPLENQFGYKAEVETRLMPYRALVRLDSTSDRLRSINLKREENFSFGGIDYKNIPITVFVSLLSSYCENDMPYVDETGIDYTVDISIQAMMTDMKDVTRALKKIGLNLVVKYKPMQVLVVRPLSLNAAAN